MKQCVVYVTYMLNIVGNYAMMHHEYLLRDMSAKYMDAIAIISIAVTLLCGLLFFEKTKNSRGIISVKTALSFLFVVTAIMQPHPIRPYYTFLLAGLVFCFGGDVFLATRRSRAFIYGLMAFTIGHVSYIVGFCSIVRIHPGVGLAAAIVMITSGTVYVRLLPYLGKMRIPVLIYIIVISVMLVAAWSVKDSSAMSIPGRSMIIAGAVLFYCSDLFVARERFVKSEYLNRFIGLPLYYVGQYLLAFSPGFIL